MSLILWVVSLSDFFATFCVSMSCSAQAVLLVRQRLEASLKPCQTKFMKVSWSLSEPFITTFTKSLSFEGSKTARGACCRIGAASHHCRSVPMVKTKLYGICGLRFLKFPLSARQEASKGQLAVILWVARKADDWVTACNQTTSLSCCCHVVFLRCYFGAAHGIAGILHTLLQLPAELALALELRRRWSKLKTSLASQWFWHEAGPDATDLVWSTVKKLMDRAVDDANTWWKW